MESVSDWFTACREHVRQFEFLAVGFRREINRPKPERGSAGTSFLAIREPDGARACRRNIAALSSVLVVAGFSGADPRDLSLFGVKPGGDRGVIVLGAAAFLAQIYWYFLRYRHMKQDMVIEQLQSIPEVRVAFEPGRHVHHKGSDLMSNRICFFMTVCSWYFVYSWINWPF